MQKMIMLDLDDTLCDLSSLLKESITKRTGKNIPVHEWHDYNLGSIFGMDGDVVIQSIIEDNLFEKVKPFSDVKDGIDELLMKGFRVSIVTAREGIDKKGEQTFNWLRKNRINFSHLFLTSHQIGKHEIAERLQPKYSLDDNLDYVFSCYDHVGTSVIKTMPWNKLTNSKSIARVDNFRDFVNLIKVKEDIPIFS